MNQSLRVHFVAPLAVPFRALPTAPALLAQSGTLQSVEWEVTGMAAPLYAIVGISDGGHALSRTRLGGVIEPNQFGATAAIVNAEPYRGRRIRLRALIRTDSATAGGSTWLRIDGTSGRLLLENNKDRMLIGTTGWSEQMTTLDMPTSATRIIYGLILSNGGTLHAKG